jgi:hypothetical protein
MVEMLNPGSREGATGARDIANAYEAGRPEDTATDTRRLAAGSPASIRAELSGSYIAMAAGVVVDYEARRRGSPVCELARRLIAAGHDAAAMLLVYRGATLCFEPRPLAVWAGLRVRESDNAHSSAHFAKYAPPRDPESRFTGHLAAPGDMSAVEQVCDLRSEGAAASGGIGQ